MSLQVLHRRSGPAETAESSHPFPVRATAFALAALLVSFLVVERSASALRGSHERSPEVALGTERPRAGDGPHTANSQNMFRSPVIELTDDDEGVSMFGDRVFVPGRAELGCITVAHRGNLPANVTLGAEVSGTLAEALQMRVEIGSGGSFGDCDTFVAGRALYEGTLGAFASAHGPAGPLPAFTSGGSVARTFRFTFTLDPAFTDQGASSSAAFVWSATPA